MENRRSPTPQSTVRPSISLHSIQRTAKTIDSYRVHQKILRQSSSRTSLVMCSGLFTSPLLNCFAPYTRSATHSNTHPFPKNKKRDAPSSHENSSDGTLVLGHTSVLTSLLLSKDQRYIITADHDVRVSWHPQGFVVEMYCLGHER